MTRPAYVVTIRLHLDDGAVRHVLTAPQPDEAAARRLAYAALARLEELGAGGGRASATLVRIGRRTAVEDA